MALITCRDVSFAYSGGTVCEGIDFALERGDRLCIVGENGAGKSTLLRGLLRLKRPLSGSIEYGEGLKQREIGYLPQQTETQKDFPASAFEVALSGRLASRGARPFYSSEDRRITEKNLARFGALELRDRCYRELSGGQQQRVLLARALGAASRLLVLDEPAAGLDPLIAAELYASVDEVCRERGMAVVMVTHDVLAALGHADKILHLGHRQLYFGAAKDYPQTDAARRLMGGQSHA